MNRLISITLALVTGAVFPGPARADRDGAFTVASEWLSNVRANDAKGVSAATTVPFLYRTTNRRKKCEGEVKDVAALNRWLECFRKSQNLLIEELAAADGVALSPGGGAVPTKLSQMKKSVTGDGMWVQAFLNGDGISYGFLIFVTKPPSGRGQVKAVLIDVSFDGG